jgi:hypothetical protein
MSHLASSQGGAVRKGEAEEKEEAIIKNIKKRREKDFDIHHFFLSSPFFGKATHTETFRRQSLVLLPEFARETFLN